MDRIFPHDTIYLYYILCCFSHRSRAIWNIIGALFFPNRTLHARNDNYYRYLMGKKTSNNEAAKNSKTSFEWAKKMFRFESLISWRKNDLVRANWIFVFVYSWMPFEKTSFRNEIEWKNSAWIRWETEKSFAVFNNAIFDEKKLSMLLCVCKKCQIKFLT